MGVYTENGTYRYRYGTYRFEEEVEEEEVDPED